MRGFSGLRRLSRLIVGIVALGLLAPAGTAGAEPTVAVLSVPEAPERPGFAEALRIQLSGAASVEQAGVLAPGTQSERVEAAVEATEAAGATIGVWVEGPVTRADGQRELVVFVVGKAKGRAVMEVVRTPAERSSRTPDPAVDRSLALKVRALIGDLVATRGVLEARVIEPVDAPSPEEAAPDEPPQTASDEAAQAMPDEAGLDEPAPDVVQDGRASSLRLRVRGELGPISSAQAQGARLGARAGIGTRFELEAFATEIVARADLLEPAESQNADGRVEVSELVPGLELRLDTRAGGLRLGGALGAELRLLGAEGTTRGGARGSTSAHVPALFAGPYAALPLGRMVELRLALALALALREERLALNDVPIVETGRLRATAALLLAFHAP